QNRGDVFPAKTRRGAETPLAGDQLIASDGAAHRDRLEQAGRLDRRLKLRELGLVELAPRLVGVRLDLRDREPLIVACDRRAPSRGWRGKRRGGGACARDECFESASESSRFF